MANFFLHLKTSNAIISETNQRKDEFRLSNLSGLRILIFSTGIRRLIDGVGFAFSTDPYCVVKPANGLDKPAIN